MHLHSFYVVAFLFIVYSGAYETPTAFTLNVIDAFSEYDLTEDSTPPEYFYAIYNTAYRFTIDMFNNKTCDYGNLLPNTTLVLNNLIEFSPLSVVKQIIQLSDQGESLAIGIPNPERVLAAGITGAVLDVAVLSSYGYSSELDNRMTYPYVSRTYVNSQTETDLLLRQLLYYGDIKGPGWDKIAILSGIDFISVGVSNELVLISPDYGISVVVYQQFLEEPEQLDIELQEIRDSKARVIFCAVLGDFVRILEFADEAGLVGDHYVWVIPSYTASSVIADPSPLLTGILTTNQVYPISIGLPDPFSECFINAYVSASPDQYLGAGGDFPPGGFLTWEVFDTILTVAHALEKLDENELLDGRHISAELWSETIRSVEFEGITGTVSFDENGNRIGYTGVLYLQDNTEMIVCAVDLGNGLEQLTDVVWYSNTTEIPDLDIREPFHYWSCKDGKERFDATGKTIIRQTPDGSDVDEISSHYHCDNFIDCKNMSDEMKNCSTNYLILYILFGILSFTFILVAVALFVFVIVFGILLKYQHVRTRSPFFLLILLISVIIGFISIFSFYGKPHPVACAFQPWLLGIPAISMIAVLSAKNLRVYRIFKYPLKRVRVSDAEVFLIWTIFTVPAIVILILWMIISTPTADFIPIGDEEHYVCTTGGFTGSPGGYIFFGIFVGYGAIVLGIGAIISILSRNIPSMFNESRLLTISIYNLGFLIVVIIPVYLVVLPINPFSAWILRTCAVLYAFGTTMFVQFGYMIFRVLIINRGKNVLHNQNISSSKNTLSHTTRDRNEL